MMMTRNTFVPSIFGESFFDDFFGFPTRDHYRRVSNTNGLMQTDITQDADGYHVTMNLPGFQKEDIKGEIKDGYLTVTASTNTSNDTKDAEGNYVRRERYSGTCSRSFYVGDEVTQEDIRAKYQDGVLSLDIPKKDEKPKLEEPKYIAIEG